MPEILDGRAVAAALTEDIKARADALRRSGIAPTLAVVRVGERADDLAYERGALNRARAAGVEVRRVAFPAGCSTAELAEAVASLSADGSVHGALILMPLPPGIDADAVRAALAPAKDVDGVTFASRAGVYSGRGEGFPPCTAAACMEILNHYGIDPEGKSAVVLGRSLVVGRPAAMMLLERGTTVTVCHTKTHDAAALARSAEILVAAMGRAGAVTPEFIGPGQVVIDVGISVDESGRLRGDLSPQARTLAAAYTPVPGGVGSVTTAVLMKHVVRAAENLSRPAL